jgi:hypothetical protein
MNFASCSGGAKEPSPDLRAPHPTEQQPHRLREGGPRQPDWRARCRPLAFALLMTLPLTGAVLASGACGPVEFVPSPFTPQKVELVYSAQEDITVVRWRISSRDPAAQGLSFEILEQTGQYGPIDFSRSVYAGGGAACADGDGSCFQYVVRGAYAPPGKGAPVRALHAGDGTLPGGRPTARTVDRSLTVDSFFHTGNDLVYVNITDAVASDGPYVFARPYERTMWATNGLCLSGSPPDGVGFSPLDKTGGFPPTKPLTDDGLYCVAIRPVPADAGPAALAQRRVATLPELVPVHVTYTPPVETSPIIYQLVLDLEIPIAERCASALQKIERLVDDTMSSVGVPFVKLPTINLAADTSAAGGGSSCAQPQTRALPAETMAEAVKQTVARFPQIYQQFHFLYFNNLNAPLPPSLTSSLQTLFDDLSRAPPAGHNLQLIPWMFNPGLASLTGPSGWKLQTWQDADDPDFAKTLASYAQTTLPFTSQIFDKTTPVPFFSDDQVATFAGKMFKLCTQTRLYDAIVAVKGRTWLGDGPIWPINANDPPGDLVTLNDIETNQPAPSFVPVSVETDLQVCTRFCTGHPYVSTSGTGVLSWSSDPACAVTN